MAKVLVLYYSSYGHIEQMAEAVAEGARGAGAQVDILRVPETAPEAVVKAFERRGFVWGGKWFFWDLVHFEYRPEILFLNGEKPVLQPPLRP